jgi:hypothetical protein
MMNTMVNTGSMGLSFLPVFFHLHLLFVAATAVGFVLFAAWAMRNLAADKLKTMAVWLLIVGIAGTLLSASFSPIGGRMAAKSGGMCGGMNGGECPMMKMMKEMGGMEGMGSMMMEADDAVIDTDEDAMPGMMQM